MVTTTIIVEKRYREFIDNGDDDKIFLFHTRGRTFTASTESFDIWTFKIINKIKRNIKNGKIISRYRHRDYIKYSVLQERGEQESLNSNNNLFVKDQY